MGSRMARRVGSAGFPLTVWNRRAAPADPFRELGASVAATPAEAASRADIVISMVADDEASRTVWQGKAGALLGARPETVLVESSTVSPVRIRELAEAAHARGCTLLDAPVTGSKRHASAGELLFLVGGDVAALARVRPVLTAMSREIIHVGPGGSGARLKLINNFLCGVQAAALAEAVALIESSGLDREAALQVLENGAPGSPLVKALAARMAAHDYDVNFMLALMRKDLAYAVADGTRNGVPLDTARAACEIFDRAIAKGWGEADFSAVVEVLRRPM